MNISQENPGSLNKQVSIGPLADSVPTRIRPAVSRNVSGLGRCRQRAPHAGNLFLLKKACAVHPQGDAAGASGTGGSLSLYSLKPAAAAHCVSLNQAPPDCTPESGARAKAVFIVLSMPPGMQRFIAGRNSSGYNERNSSSGPL